MIPSLIQLPVTRTGAPGTEGESGESEEARVLRLRVMARDMWQHILSFLADHISDGNTVCRNITRLCEVNNGPWAQSDEPWAGNNVCRDYGWIWKETSKRLGWYGQYDNWDDLFRSITRNPIPGLYKDSLISKFHTPSPKLYFKYCCERRMEFMTALEDWPCCKCPIRGWLDDDEDRHDLLRAWLDNEHRHELPYMRAMLIAVFYRRPELLQDLPTDDVDYNVFATSAVCSNGQVLRYVPGSLDVHGDPPNIVPPIAGYTEFAKAAVREAGSALQWVPGSTGEGGRVQLQLPIADYVEIAKLAVAQNPISLRDVPGSWSTWLGTRADQRSINPLPDDDYVEIAKVALAYPFDESPRSHWPGMKDAVKRCIDPSLKARLEIQE